MFAPQSAELTMLGMWPPKSKGERGATPQSKIIRASHVFTFEFGLKAPVA